MKVIIQFVQKLVKHIFRSLFGQEILKKKKKKNLKKKKKKKIEAIVSGANEQILLSPQKNTLYIIYIHTFIY